MQKLTYTELPADLLAGIQRGAGLFTIGFDPEDPQTGDDLKEIIFAATTGGVTIACMPTFTDFFEDVDNAPKNTKEGKMLDGYDALISATQVNFTEASIKGSIGAADSEAVTGVEGLTKITPRMALQDTDFIQGLGVICNWGDNGSFLYAELNDALTDGGLSIQTSDDGKGQGSISYRGHTTTEDLDRPPIEFYLFEKQPTTYSLTQTLATHIISDVSATSVTEGTRLIVNLTAAEGYEIDTVTVTMGGEAVTGAYDSATGKVTIASVAGNVVITATETQGA